MKSGEFSKLWLFSVILICCYQQIWTEGLVEESTTENNSTADKQAANHGTKQPKAELNATTITATTTESESEEEEITTLPADFDLDGRSAFINNQFVAEGEESLSDITTSISDPVQLPKLTILMTSDIKSQDSNNDAVAQTSDAEIQKLSQNPILGHDVNQFDEYEEEETAEISEGASESDSIPQNCEDTQESLEDNDEGNDPADQENLDNTDANNLEPNEPYDSHSDYETQTNTKSNTNQELSYEPAQYPYATHPAQQQNPLKPATHSNLVKQDHTQSYYERQYAEQQQDGPSTNQNFDHKPHYNVEKSPRPLLSKPTKLESSFYNKRLYNGTLFHYANTLPESSSSLELSNSLNPSIVPSLSYDNSKVETSPFSSTSVYSKKFKTISSSIQYVSTPLADLVFKYSIGMAKHSKGANNSSENKPQIINVPYEVYENIKEKM